MRFERALVVARRSAIWLALAVIFVPEQVIAVDQAAAARRLDPLLKALYQAQSGTQKGAPRVAISSSQALETVRLIQSPAGTEPSSLLKLLVRFDGNPSELEKVGFKVQSKMGPVLTGVLAPERITELAGLTGLAYVQLSRPWHASWQPAGGSPGMLPLEGTRRAATTASAGSSAELGSGALIGIVDTGADIHHQDFRKTDGTTRIRYLLDLSDPGDVNDDGVLDGPDDFGGTLYTETEINQALSGSGSMRQRDRTGHGTHALSVAAGDDPDRPGVAPGADLIVVKATRQDGTLEFESVDVLHALAFIDARAAELELPYVVNLSLGSLFSSHDGRSLEEIAIDSLVGAGIPGKSVVVAAGNSASHRSGHYHHFQGTAFAGATADHTLVVPPYSHPNPEIGDDRILLDVWYKGGDRLSIAVTAPDGATRVEAHPGEISDVATPFGHVFIANMGGTNPLNGDTEALVLIYDREGAVPASGNWKVSVSGDSVEAGGVYHAWLIDGVSRVGEVAPYLSTGDHRYLVGKPGAAYNAVTVGSFARHAPGTSFRTSWTDLAGVLRVDPTAVPEDISDFSSAGSTRDGRIKPELVAPGEEVVGAMSADANPTVSPTSVYREHGFSSPVALVLSSAENRGFGILQGTSFAAPVVTGQIARILAAHPELDAIQVRNTLINSAQADAWTGNVPNVVWGYGKIASEPLVPADSPVPSLRIETATLPAGWKDRLYNFFLTASGGAGPYTWRLASGTLPAGMELVQGSQLTGRPRAAAQVDLIFEVADGSVPQQINRRTLQLVIGETPPLEILTTHLPAGIVGRPYSAMLQASGGTPPYHWTLAYGALPAGLSLTPAGALQGTPTSLGQTSFTVSVGDIPGTTVLRSFTFRITNLEAGQWRPVGSVIAGGVSDIALDPESPGHLFAVVDKQFGSLVSESMDAGTTWRNITVNNGISGAASITINPVTSDLWATDYGSRTPYRYNQEKRMWENRSLCGVDKGLDLQFDDLGHTYFLSYKVDCFPAPERNSLFGFYRSPDDGLTWELLGGFPPPAEISYHRFGSLGVIRGNSNYMFAGHAQWAGEWTEGFYRSLDGGRSWMDLGVGPEKALIPRVSQKDPFDIIRISEKPGNVPWSVGSPVFESSLDGGLTWRQHSLPGNPRICSLVRSDSDPFVLLVGTSEGLFKSADRGESWSKLYLPGLTPDRCTGKHAAIYAPPNLPAMAIDSKDADRMFIGTLDNMIYVSPDGGLSWRIIGDGLVSRQFNGVAISRSDPENMMVISASPYVSRTGGNRWILSADGILPLTSEAVEDYYGFPMISPDDPNLYFFVDEPNLYRSEDRGNSWTSLRPALVAKDGTPLARRFYSGLAVDPFDANVLLARLATTDGNDPLGIWRSNDRGATWQQVNEPESIFDNLHYPGSESNISFANDVEGRVYTLGPKGLFRSDNRGDSWVLIAPLLPEVEGSMPIVVESAPSDSRFVYAISGSGSNPDRRFVHAVNPSGNINTTEWAYPYQPMSLAVDANVPTVAYLGLRGYSMINPPIGGILATRDGGQTWARLASFSPRLSVISLVTHPTISGIVYAATMEDGVYRTTDGGLRWEKLDNFGDLADVVNVAIRDPLNPLALFAGTQGFGVQVSADGGRTFVPRVNGLKNLNVRTLAFDMGDASNPSLLYAGTEEGLFKSSDAGLNWQATGMADGLVTDLAVDTGARPRRIRLTSYKRGLAISADQGNTFKVKSSGLASLDLTSVATQLKGDKQRTWVTMRGGDGVAYSDDNENVWHSAAGNGLTDRNVNDLVIEPGGRLWVAADNGIFTSDNDGLTWNPVVAGLPAGVPATSLSIDPNTEEVLVSLFSAERGGVFRGANLTGVWEKFVDGLHELRVNRLTNDGGHDVGAERGTRFYASTHGDGLYEMEVSSQEAPPPVILTTGLAEGVENRDYRETASAGGGVPPYGWSVVMGSLPSGLTLDRSSGTISGRPAAPGHYPFTLQVVDTKLRFAQKELTLRVIPSFSTVSALTVEKAGAGEGTVRSEPSGISCGDRCHAIFPTGTSLRLLGEPTSGSYLSRWEGAEDCEDGVVEMKSAKTCRAIFEVETRNALDFYTLQPCRLLDTRSGLPLRSQVPQVFDFAGKCGIPGTAKAIVVNVTTVGPTAPGNLNSWRSDIAEPLTSMINFTAGSTRANNAVLSLSRDGHGSVVVKSFVAGDGSVHLVVDVSGYFE